MDAVIPPDRLRRASYGPSSPHVGQRGARTRQAIIDAALDLFATKGFHATLIDDIANAAGTSRATLYQYFESKEQLFVELMHVSGADLLRVARRLGPLGPTAEGFDALRRWIGEWACVQDRYSTMFVQWATIDSPEAPLRPLLAGFIETGTARLSERIADAPLDGVPADDAAVALLATFVRVNYYRHTDAARGLSGEVVLDTLAQVVQLALYPATPPAALAVGAARTSSRIRPRPTPVVVPLRAERGAPWSARFAGRSERALVTVGRLLDAGAAVFANQGYFDSSVDEILKQAGVGRGTFYKYFNDRLDVLSVLAVECAEALETMVERFAQPDLTADPAALRAWLADFVAFHRRYAGVFRVWSERQPSDPALDEVGRQVSTATLATFDRVLRHVQRPYRFDVPAASLVLLALLERAPGYATGTRYELPPDRLVEVMALLIERGLVQGERRAPSERLRAVASPSV